jgi:hypothetical protein
VTKFTKKRIRHIKLNDKIMMKIPALLTSWRSNLTFVLGLPLFCLLFVLLYRPVSFVSLLDMGGDWLNFSSTIIMCILFGVMLLSRGILMVVSSVYRLTWLRFVAWELCELIVMSMFSALYVTLMYHGEMAYFYVVGQCFYWLILILIFPYVIFNLMFAYLAQSESMPEEDESLMRFVDNTQKLKLMIASSAVLYVEADENYVHVRYLEGERVKDYPLRASMKSLEQLMLKHGLIRCQRSYYINPLHVKVLRRDKEGVIVAELDVANQKSIPVSPKYYDSLAKWL